MRSVGCLAESLGCSAQVRLGVWVVQLKSGWESELSNSVRLGVWAVTLKSGWESELSNSSPAGSLGCHAQVRLGV